MPWTNRGAYRMLSWLRGGTVPANFYAALVCNTNAPVLNTILFSELDEIAEANGYTSGGIIVNTDSTDWDTISQDNANTRSYVQLKDYVWTADGGPIPGSGDGARYLVILDNTATVGDREVYFYHDLTSDRAVSDGQSLSITDAEVGINTTTA